MAIRTLAQIGSEPQPGDSFIRDGRVWEVVEVDNGWVLYRTERVRLKRPALMTAASWKTLAADRYTSETDK